MASRNQFTQFTNRLFTSTLLCIVFCALTVPTQVFAKADAIPSLNEFIETVKDGNADILRGVYIANVMAYPDRCNNLMGILVLFPQQRM